ncbi:NAD(P)/FAD-dependent oxidoreductase [Paenibacillus sp. YPG26]|uniref:NAD(P)/FAD-dependent oxidoreductase n=1 Tax=Paenibacillus sp. YPG26 TaxID=2878915 RepID=UPI0020414661|nr:NAD(P)/FAD-dependent oxidoreductase [Paenibacillus sp. YPG26]USB31914.1 NAD(P)/FAD-dependent oxidoreductase [Paenibacillus sp. YPG26]
MTYDCIIIGGGIAGLQAAIQLGRYVTHQILVIDSGSGRSTLCRNYHNILGWPDGISGEELRNRGKAQAVSLGVKFVQDKVARAAKQDQLFELAGEQGVRYQAKTVLLATGLMDRLPDIPGIRRTLGRSVYVCPDCDGYEIHNRKTVVMGSGNSGANMALLLAEQASEVIFINHEQQAVDAEILMKIKDRRIRYIETGISRVLEEQDGMIQSVILEDGTVIPAERGFIGFGGNQVHSELAEQLGAKLYPNKHVEADPRSRMTNTQNLWIAGDLGVHAEQVTVSMGDGTLAAISIHKVLRELKRAQEVNL